MRRVALAVGPLGVAVTVLALSTPLATQSRSSDPARETIAGREAVAREVIVKFRATPRVDDVRRAANQFDAEMLAPIGRAGAHRLRSRSLTAATLLRVLRNAPDVEFAEPNLIVHAFTQPNDPSFSSLWGLLNTGQAVNGGPAGTPNADIHATGAWDVSLGSTDHVVGVVDTGIDYTHPDLAPNIWSAPTSFTVTMGGVQVTCPAGTHGFNVITQSCDPMDDNNHGTHVSGTIGAVGNNGVGVVGVNWTASIMGLKFIGANGSGTLADAVDAIDLAIQTKQIFGAAANVRILSNSWGSNDFSQALLDEINAAGSADMLFVAAAGNNGVSSDIFPTYPGAYNAANLISVAATTNTDARAWFSNYGPTTVHLGAPGQDVYSTVIGNSYAFFSGTSMATPHVSGAAALVLSRCEMSTDDLKETILNSTEPIPSMAGITITGGRLDVNSAIHSCLSAPTTPSNLTATTGDGKISLAWTEAVGATSYTVKRSLTSGGPYTTIAQSLRALQYVDTNVTNGTTYYYVVSASNALGTSGDSNEASATPHAPGDLVIASFTVPSTSGAGKTVTIAVTTKNQGSGPVGATTTRLYLSVNAAIDGTDLNFGSVSVPPLAPGATSDAIVSFTIPADTTSGLKYVLAKADADGVETETQEYNNQATKIIQIGPDLVVSALTVPSLAGQGATIAVSDTAKNQGGGDAGASTTAFYLSTDVLLDASDVRLSGGRAVPALVSGTTSSGTTIVTIPSSTPTGSYFLLAVADADKAVTETQELNNVLGRSIKVGGDLTVSALTVPAKSGPGLTITVSDTTSNSGAGPIGASVTRFYLSANPLLDDSDTAFAGGRNVPDLAAGASSTGTTALTIPATLTPGTYYLFAKADADNVVPETQEANNTSVRTIAIGGDLTVTSLSVPFKAAAGTTIAVTDTTTNQGGGPIDASTTRFYLSPNAILDSTDMLLPGGRPVPPLAVGASSTGTTSITLPASLAPGTYYLYGKADGDNAAAESNENNNAVFRAIQVTAGS